MRPLRSFFFVCLFLGVSAQAYEITPFQPDARTLDQWTAAAVQAALQAGPSKPGFPSSVRKVSSLELVRNEVFFRGFQLLKGRILKPKAVSDSTNLLDSLAGVMDRVQESAFYNFFRGSVFERLDGLLTHPALKNDAGTRDLGQFARFHQEFKADINADAKAYGAKFYAREVFAQGAVNSFAIKLFAWMNGRQTVPDRPSVNSISLLHPLVDAAMDQGWMKPQTFGKLNDFLTTGKAPDIDGDYERVLFDYLFRFEKAFPRKTVPGFWFSLSRLFQTQVESLKQKKAQMSLPDYYRIALDKGGLSTVLAAYTALGPLSPQQYAFFYRSGGVFQVIDDLLDIGKDQAEGVRTVWTEALQKKDSLSLPLLQLFALESRIEDDLPALTSEFKDPQAFANVYSFGFKLSLMRGLARQRTLLDPATTDLMSGRMSLTLASFRNLMTVGPAQGQPVEEGSDLWLFQELVSATEDY